MNQVTNIQGIEALINSYDVFILDQWGVIHDGKRGFPKAIKCVEKLFEKKKDIIIISNSSKRKNETINRLPKLGFNKNYFKEVMTSGEIIWQSLKNRNHDYTKKIKEKCYHLFDKSNFGGKKYIDGLNNYTFVDSVDKADFILGCTTTPGLQTIDYIPFLKKALKNNIPFICANPDFETLDTSTNELVICMGTIAELYKNLGGEIITLGKPQNEIYVESLKKINNLNKSRIIAVGDSILHDIKGANKFGIDSLFITSGIHHSSFDSTKPEWNSNINKIINLGIEPTFLCSNFQL
tara:strand:- start:350 stop:1231 length:882 start_codon:yes stop_codon:yes gene_type:complete